MNSKPQWQTMLDDNAPKIAPLRAAMEALEAEQRIAVTAVGYYRHLPALEKARSDYWRAKGYCDIAKEQIAIAERNAASAAARSAEGERWNAYHSAQREGGEAA